MSTRTFGERVWGGDLSTVSEARQRYRRDPIEQLIPFSVVLYSYRFDPRFAAELLQLRSALLDRATALIKLPISYGKSFSQTDIADVLSTILFWMSRRSELGAEANFQARRTAKDLCLWGIDRSDPVNETGHSWHTWCLLRLTLAQILINENEKTVADGRVGMVRVCATRISDPNQRARVYRKLGMLFRQSGSFFRGFGWGVRACFVPGEPLAVRAKSVVALCGWRD